MRGVLELACLQYPMQKCFTGGKHQAERRAQQMVWNLEDVAEADAVAKSTISSLKTFSECVEFYKLHDSMWESNKAHLDRVELELEDYSIENIQDEFSTFIQDTSYSIYQKTISMLKMKLYELRVELPKMAEVLLNQYHQILIIIFLHYLLILRPHSTE